MESLTGFHIISFVGRQGSGKTFLGRKLAHLLECERIEVSDIVRSLHSGKKRSELPDTAELTKQDPDWLGRSVGEGVFEACKRKPYVVLTGVRELAVHAYLTKRGATIYSFELTSDPFTRCERLLRLRKIDSEEEFLDHEISENKMNIQAVLDEARIRIITSDRSDADELIQQTLKKLRSSGAV
jgi:cytidylate kinase